ncbi:MAG: carbohydrate ABC transporter permease [Candidatus Zhuqueibacterota bacterium]
MRDRRIKRFIPSVALHLVMLIAAFLTIVPFIWMVSASFMKSGGASTFPPRFIPETFVLDQYITLFNKLNVGRYFFNSFLLATSVTIVSLFINSLAGYAFSKFAFRGKQSIFALLLTSMIIPGQVTMLPVFLILNKLYLLNTYFGIILPGMASIFAIFLIRQYLFSVPDSLIEAARIDGADDFMIYWKIILPLAAPVLVTLALFTFMGTWNDFLWPLIVLTRQDMFTLPVALANLLGEYAHDVELMMAGAVITVMPIIFIFIFLQKYYIRGIMLGSVKG